jgi:hypothetical protein
MTDFLPFINLRVAATERGKHKPSGAGRKSNNDCQERQPFRKKLSEKGLERAAFSNEALFVRRGWQAYQGIAPDRPRHGKK